MSVTSLSPHLSVKFSNADMPPPLPLGPPEQTCATLMKWATTAALCGAVGLLSTMSWIHWETLLKRVMKRSRMGLSTVQPCITKLW